MAKSPWKEERFPANFERTALMLQLVRIFQNKSVELQVPTFPICL